MLCICTTNGYSDGFQRILMSQVKARRGRGVSDWLEGEAWLGENLVEGRGKAVNRKDKDSQDHEFARLK